MERLKTVRNTAIVALIAAAVFLLPGGGRAARALEGVLLVAFGFGIVYLGVRQYREHRVALHSLGDRYRTMLYGAAAAMMLGMAFLPPVQAALVLLFLGMGCLGMGNGSVGYVLGIAKG